MDLDLNAMATRVHEANQKWWHDLNTGEKLERNKHELLMLMTSEVAEAMEGERKSLMDDKLPHRPMAEVEIADVLIRALDYAGGTGMVLSNILLPTRIPFIDNKAEALLQMQKTIGLISMRLDGDKMVRDQNLTEPYLMQMLISQCFAYCNKFGYDLMGAYEEKMAFNAVRKDHQVEARKASNGKKW